MIRGPPKSTRTDTLFPYTTLFRTVTRGFPCQPELSAAASGMTPGLFPPVTTDGNMVRVLSCSGGRTEWVYRANEGQWILQHYAATGDEPCDVAQPLAKGEP